MKLSYDSENLQKITQIEKVSFEINTICDENPMFHNDGTSGAVPSKLGEITPIDSNVTFSLPARLTKRLIALA